MVKYNALTQMTAKNLNAGKYADGQGLWLIKRNRQLGKWILRTVMLGKRREMGLGPWPDVSIAEAREQAAKARRTIRDGRDPIEERCKRRHQVKRLTVEEAVYGCFEARQADLKGDGKAGRWLSPMTQHVFPKLGTEAVEDLDQRLIKSTLEPIWHEKADTARKALNRLNLTLQHAAALGLDVDLQATMKARALLGKQRHVARHIPAMPYQDVPAYFAHLATLNQVAAKALRFLILTAARTSEVRLVTFDEFENGVWQLSNARTKTGQPHRIPLSPPAQKLIDFDTADRRSSYLFTNPSGKPLSDMAMSSLMKREELTARPHGFRASFRTWMEEKTDYPFEVKELALGHQVGDKIVRAYQRSDHLEARTELMRKWGEYVSGDGSCGVND
ncbi:MAG: integrase arm-type DNA-binding domain-containing protein [Pseudomonadota bacterium]